MVLFLSLRDGGMLADNRPDQLGVLLQFLICGLNALINGCRIGQEGNGFFTAGQDRVPTEDELTVCGEELVLNIRFIERRRGALGFALLKLAVALPDDAAVLVIRVPDLLAVNAAAISAEDLGSKHARSAIASTDCLAPGHFGLHHVKLGSVDDGGVAIFNVVAGDFAFVLLLRLGQKVNGETLLKQGIALVFFIRQDAENCGRVPRRFPCGTEDAARFQLPANAQWRAPLQKEPKDEANRLCLPFIDDRCAIRPLVISQKTLVWHADLSVSKAFSLSPSDVLGDGSALFLRQG